MRIFTPITPRWCSRWTRVLGALSMVALMVPALVVSQSPAPVDLGSAAKFAVLAGSLISNIPTSAITGDVGISPAAGSSITGLTSQEVTGTIFTVDSTGPAGSVADATELSAAKGALTTAYNDAAGRTPIPTGPFLDPGSGNIGGMTLVPGLYKFTAGASITGSDVTLSGSATDVWIFQIASDLGVGNGIQVTLAGGAQAGNVFWQVGSSATLGVTSQCKGTIMADQSITLNTGARLDGRALANIAAVTMASNSVTLPVLASAVENAGAPQGFALFQNYPNPFNPSTRIQYSLEKSAHVSLKIYNVLGLEVATLVNDRQEAGTYAVPFSTDTGTPGLSSGIYFYRLEAGDFVSIRRMTFTK